jgi:hypothetical protein
LAFLLTIVLFRVTVVTWRKRWHGEKLDLISNDNPENGTSPFRLHALPDGNATAPTAKAPIPEAPGAAQDSLPPFDSHIRQDYVAPAPMDGINPSIPNIRQLHSSPIAGSPLPQDMTTERPPLHVTNAVDADFNAPHTQSQSTRQPDQLLQPPTPGQCGEKV